MSHQRTEIRNAIVTLLSGISGVQQVYPSQTRRLYAAELPAILVYTKSEAAEIFIEAPREYKRTMKLAIEVVAKAGEEDDLDNTLDDICKEIETRIFRNETLNGLVSDLKYSDTEIDFVPDGDQPVGAGRITFDCEYFTLAPEEQVALDDWSKAHVEMLPEGAIEDDTEPAKDDLTLDHDEE